MLVGSEVKSMRAGKVELVDAYATVERGELWLKQMYIAPFEQATAFPHEPRRVAQGARAGDPRSRGSIARSRARA